MRNPTIIPSYTNQQMNKKTGGHKAHLIVLEYMLFTTS